jgi:sterol desaturase/sphingolipid hydroxylase (fatty acid hydroxylase superfamily)
MAPPLRDGLLLALAVAVVPTAVALLVSPAARAWLRGTGSVRQTLSNASVGLVFLASQLALRGALVGVFAGAAAVVPWKLPGGVASALLAFVLLDLVYYVQHRVEHAVPVLWAIHAVHHQSRDYNLSVSLRVGALASLSTAVFHASLALAGVTVTQYAVVATAHAVLLFGLHARTKLAFGPGRVFNAPVFHRVHHGADRAYVDKNFGGVFLVFDRLFGTFAPYTTEPTFGVVGEACPELPLAANAAPWVALAAKVRRQPTLRGKLRALLVHAPEAPG